MYMKYKKTSGIPKCATLANCIRDDFEVMLKNLKKRKRWKPQMRSNFNLLAKLLGGLYAEFSSLAKKQPDALTNAFKTNQVNRVLSPLKQIMEV